MRTGSLASWTIIVVATLGIFVLGTLSRSLEHETDDTATLVVLTMQARVLTAAAAFAPEVVQQELPQLDRFAVTPAVARALAALNAFAGGPAGEDRATALLARHADAADDPELHAAVLRALDDPDSLSDSERQRIEAEMDWFGRLLLASDRAPSDPLRRAVMADAYRALAAIVVVLVLAVGGVLLGFVLLVLALVRRSSGQLATRFRPDRSTAGIYLQAVAAYLALLFAAQALPGLAGLEHPAFGLACLLAASLAGVLWPVLRGAPVRATMRDLGVHRGFGWIREVGSGVVGYVTMLPIVAVGFLTSVALIVLSGLLAPPADDEAPQLISHPVLVWMARGDVSIRLGVLFLAAVFAPVAEELMFRGALLRALRARLGPLLAAGATAFVFAVIHPQGPLLVPALMALAFGFALLREWRDSIVAPMVAHSLHNGALVCFMWILFG